MTTDTEKLPLLAAQIDQDWSRTISELSALVAIPSVSWAAYDRAHVRASADAVKALAESTGLFEHVDIVHADTPTGEQGQPAVIATRPAKSGAPTVLLYAHHDVQPWGDEALWNTPPFEATEIDGRLYGRGASDDKAGVITHIAALRALAAVTPDPDLGIVLFIEGEEEAGSLSFTALLDAHAERLRADAIVVADSDNWSVDVPSLTVSLRGNVAFRVDVTTLAQASHSGMYGGVAPDALLALIRTLDSLWHPDGSVAVAGLESVQLETPAHDPVQLRHEMGLLEGVRELGSGDTLERLWFRPAITVTGIDAPKVADASNTLIPTAGARVSVRVAPGQSSASALAAIDAHLREHAAFGARLEISKVEQGDGLFVDASGVAASTMLQSMRDAWNAEPVQSGIGGSIPFIADLQERNPAAEVLVIGVEDPDTRAHSPNESQDLGVLRRSILTTAAFLSSFGAASKG